MWAITSTAAATAEKQETPSAQPAVTERLADELAAEGLTNEAAAWYSNGISIGSRLGLATDPGNFVDYVTELLIGNQLKGVDTALDSLLQKDPTNGEALYLKMLWARRGQERAEHALQAVDE